jgi:hypothetical protein
MSNSIIETLDGEATNLALHVQLCEQRYLQLLTKLDAVDDNLHNMHVIIKDIQSKLDVGQNSQLRTYLTWAGVVITALLGAVLHLVTR